MEEADPEAYGAIPNIQRPAKRKSRSRTTSPSPSVEEAIFNYIREKSSDSECENMTFGRMVGMTLKRFTQRTASMTKVKIQTLLMEMEDYDRSERTKALIPAMAWHPASHPIQAPVPAMAPHSASHPMQVIPDPHQETPTATPSPRPSSTMTLRDLMEL